jgi:hypothetical protein
MSVTPEPEDMSLGEIEEELEMRPHEVHIHLGTDLDGALTIDGTIANLENLIDDLSSWKDRGFLMEGPVSSGHIYLVTTEQQARVEALKARHVCLKAQEGSDEV